MAFYFKKRNKQPELHLQLEVQFNLVPLPLKNNGMKKKDPEAFSSGPLVKSEIIFVCILDRNAL